MLRSRSLSSGYRVANLAETAGEVAALEVSQVGVAQSLAQAQAALTLYSEVVYPWWSSSRAQGAGAGPRG